MDYVYGVIGVQIENAFAPNYFEIPPNQSPGPTSFWFIHGLPLNSAILYKTFKQRTSEFI